MGCHNVTNDSEPYTAFQSAKTAVGGWANLVGRRFGYGLDEDSLTACLQWYFTQPWPYAILLFGSFGPRRNGQSDRPCWQYWSLEVVVVQPCLQVVPEVAAKSGAAAHSRATESIIKPGETPNKFWSFGLKLLLNSL